MKVLLSWLKDYVDIDITPQELEKKLFNVGFEVEELTYLADSIDKVVVGEVTAMEDYEGTHLHICTVDCGDEYGRDLIILTGADNVTVGAHVPAALVGATLPGGFKIKERKMVGKMSYGMLCSGEELGIPGGWYPNADVNGIMILDKDTKIGDSIVNVCNLDDYLYDISITANRPDCQSIFGIAREVAAFLGKPLKAPGTTYTETEVTKDEIKVYNEAYDLCPRFLGHYIYDVKHFESPLWMKQRLASCGMKSIDAIVDITNYVLLEIGQPMHAYDLKTLNGSTVFPRRATEGEKITTLDGKERVLSTNNLVICDAKEPIGLAGIMGGLDSEITESTEEIVLEAAKFLRDNVRKSCRALGVHTDAAGRYEKGVDEYSVEMGMARCLNLVETLQVAKISKTSFDCSGGASTQKREISVSVSQINAVLGIEVPTEKIVEILTSLEFEVTNNDGVLTMLVPRYREDVEHYQDIAEEVIREYGYEHIVPRFLTTANVTNGGMDAYHKRLLDVKKELCGEGLYEISTMSMISPKDLDALKIPADDPARKYIELLNPITENLSILRTTLVPSMLTVLCNNIKTEHNAGRFFEVAGVFLPKSLPLTEKPVEDRHLCIGVYGPDEDFYSAKAILDTVAALHGLEFTYAREKVSYLHPGRSAAVFCNGVKLGTIGQLKYEIINELSIAEGKKSDLKIFITELNYELLNAQFAEGIRFTPLSDKESASRDLSLLFNKSCEVGPVLSAIREISKLVSEVNLVDIYQSEKLGDKKSVTFSINFATSDHSVTDEEADQALSKITKKLGEQFDAYMRS